jgi:hypothetical protein
MKTTTNHMLHAPVTRFGKWSLGLALAMPVLFLMGMASMSILYPSVPAGNSIVGDLAARPALALSMLLGMAAGVLAFAAGLLAVVREKERSLWVYLSTAIGALLLVFLLGEFISPH